MNILGPFAIDASALEVQRPRIAPEIELARLQEHAERYAAFLSGPCPFRVGDVITPMADSMYRNHGKPYIVLEVVPAATSTIAAGQRLDVRIIGYHNDDCDAVKPGWIESWSWMPWTLELAQQVRDKQNADARLQLAAEGSA